MGCDMQQRQYSYKFGKHKTDCPCGDSSSFSPLERINDEEFDEEENDYGYCRECKEFFKPTQEERRDYLHKNW
jgi:hypothetical protein